MVRAHSPLRLSAQTESGHLLGTVVDVSIDPDSQLVEFYHVKPSRLLPDMVSSPLLIHRNQVISITPKKIVVDDAVLRAKQPKTAPLPSF